MRRREKRNSLKTVTSVIKPHYSHLSFDGKFFADFDFLVKILIPLTHFEISAILVNCVGGLEKIFLHWHCRKIVFHKMSISNRFQHLVALKSPKTLNSYFAPQRHHVAKLRKIRQSNCSIFYKACNTGQFLSSNEKVLFKDWDEKLLFVSIFKENFFVWR